MDDSIKNELEEVKKELLKIRELLADLLFVLAVQATEAIQTTENTSALLRGSFPESCRTAHVRLREDIIEISEKWRSVPSKDLKKHLFGHE